MRAASLADVAPSDLRQTRRRVHERGMSVRGQTVSRDWRSKEAEDALDFEAPEWREERGV
jgi:hypothetical protein